MIPVYTRAQIEAFIRPSDVIRVVEEGFAAYLRGDTVIPPVGHLPFENPEGEYHIKYGYRIGDTTFTVKIATGFPGNTEEALSTSNGVILVFSSQTGELLASIFTPGNAITKCCPSP
jgi:ornithine cyclodeaminase